MGEIETFIQSNQLFGNYVHLINDSQWDLPVPSTPKWTVLDLVGHITYDNQTVPDVLGNRPYKPAPKRERDVLASGDRQVIWAQAMEEANAAVAALPPDHLNMPVQLSFGDTPARAYLQQLIIDRVIHAWDLAHAIGADEALDPALVQTAWALFKPQAEAWRGGGVLGPAMPVADDAPPQTKLLALAGRQA